MAEPARNTIPVLHVDDEQRFTDLTKRGLEQADDQLIVETATSPAEAWEPLAEGQFECVVSDYEMPSKDGIEFLESVRDEYSDLPFILFTGKGSEEIASKAVSAGVTDYLQKGSGKDQFTVLANRITNAVEAYRTRHEHQRLERIQKATNDTLWQLYELMADQDLEFEEKLSQMLDIGVETLDLSYGYVTRVEDDTLEIVDSVGDHEGLTPGEQHPMEQTFCRQPINSNSTVTIENVVEEDWDDDPAYENSGFQFYLGSPVQVDDDSYGTLCFADSQPKEIDDHVESLVAILGQWVGMEIERKKHEQELQQRTEELEQKVSRLKTNS